jgi:hypothetical protein
MLVAASLQVPPLFAVVQSTDAAATFTANFAGLHQQRSYKRKRAERVLTGSAIGMILRWYEKYDAQAREPAGVLH